MACPGMDGPSEWVAFLVSENVELKRQVRLMKENLELRRFLEESSNEVHARACNHLKSHVYPATCSPVDIQCLACSPMQRRRMSKLLDGQGCAASSSLDSIFSSPKGANCRGKNFRTLRVIPQALFNAGLLSLQNPDRKINQGSGEAGDSQAERPLLDAEDKGKAKKVAFSDPCLPIGGRSMRAPIYFLNDLRGSQAGKEGRVIGEIAFQLDRRILSYVFPGATRLYGFTVSNITDKIIQSCRMSQDGSLDEEKRKEMSQRYLSLMCQLQMLGYKLDVHPIFSEFLINAYGILKQRDLRGNPVYGNHVSLRKLVINIMPAKFLRDTLLLLNCLCELSRDDGNPLFAW
ncbi:speriolin-like protein [Ambystoma mexicanum]|uniref:speriolin-like protein n=1 Tax=Ambystoma mexicanum TaxID=8296 RepID=UPI0037E810E8